MGRFVRAYPRCAGPTHSPCGAGQSEGTGCGAEGQKDWAKALAPRVAGRNVPLSVETGDLGDGARAPEHDLARSEPPPRRASTRPVTPYALGLGNDRADGAHGGVTNGD